MDRPDGSDQAVELRPEEVLAIHSILTSGATVPGESSQPPEDLNSALGLLIEAGIVVLDDLQNVDLPSDLLEIVSRALDPRVSVEAERESEGTRQRRAWSLHPDVMIEQSLPDERTVRFEPYPTSALIARISAFLRMTPRPKSPRDPIRVTREEFARLRDGTYTDEEASRPEAMWLRGRGDAWWVQVSCVWRSGEAIVGGQLEWVDGPDGIWLVEHGPEEVVLRASDAGSVASEILSYLPSGDT